MSVEHQGIVPHPTEANIDHTNNNSADRISLDPSHSLLKRANNSSLESDWPHNLLRCAKWSGDGGSVLTEAEDRKIRIFECCDPGHKPLEETLLVDSGSSSDLASCSPWKADRVFAMADALRSTCWFPYSSAKDLSRYCFAAAVKDHPIHLLDAASGRVRASYPIIDHRERMVAPHTMLFSDDGSTLYGGFDTAIEIFDVSRPGQEGERFKTVATRKSKDGQKGIISTLAADPTRKGLLAAGSFSGQIGLYDTQSVELRPVIIFDSSDSSGVTQIKFHPHNDQVLFSVSRKSNRLLCWDLRYGASAFHSFYRPGMTNQKIGFDIDWMGVNLITGGTDGKMRIYRLDQLSQPAQQIPISSDAISSTSFNPTSCTIITSCGSRRPSRSPHVHQKSTPLGSPGNESATSISDPNDTDVGDVDTPDLSALSLWKFQYV